MAVNLGDFGLLEGLGFVLPLVEVLVEDQSTKDLMINYAPEGGHDGSGSGTFEDVG